MDFSYFFSGAQADLLLMLLAPLACAMFRALFLWRYRTHAFTWPQLAACFHYGFWWGMDFNAYVFLILLLCVSLPTAIFPSVRPFADGLRCALVTAYLGILYLAFIGKMIFYDHFHDTFNATIRLGIHADKKNFADIFFHQHHGGLVLLGIPVYLAICVLAARALLMLPHLPYDMIAPPDGAARIACNVLCFVSAIVLFYWLRYGGTLNHRKKPEWDEVPPLVKEDAVLAKATVDDLIALELAWKKRVSDAARHSDDEARRYLAPILPESCPPPYGQSTSVFSTAHRWPAHRASLAYLFSSWGKPRTGTAGLRISSSRTRGGKSPFSCESAHRILPSFFIRWHDFPAVTREPLIWDLRCRYGIK